MGKGTDLWDDSALTEAFDHAMSTYKAMHGGNYRRESSEEGMQTNEGKEEPSLIEETSGKIELENGSHNALKSMIGENGAPYNTESAPEILPNQEHLVANLHSPEASPYSYQGAINTYSDQQGEECNLLLKQYYELEEQRQRVLEQLHQTSYWNYQALDPNSVPSSTFANDRLPFESHCCSGPLIACCSASCVSQCPGAQCLPDNGACPIAAKFPRDPLKQLSCLDDTAVKTGMIVAERAMSAMKMEQSSASEAKQKGEEKGAEGKVSAAERTETDLTVVLNAWYTAGFHTGRYLLEQSKREAHH